MRVLRVLGIGTSSPKESAGLHIQGSNGSSGANVNVAANEVFIDNNGDTGITLGSSATGVGTYAFADSTVALRGAIQYDHSDDSMNFRVSSADRMRITSTGIDVTGAVTSDGLTVGGTTDLGASIMTVVGAAGNHNTFAVGAGQNNSVTLGNFNTNDTIANLITSSSKFGSVIQGGSNGSLVLGIRDNDVADGIFVMSGTGTGGGQISNDYSRLRLSITPTTFVINETGDDADFRVESDGNANMLFVDGGANKVGIGRDPQDNGSTLQVAADATASTDLQLALRGLSNENKKLLLGFDTTSNIASITSFEAGVTHRPLHLQGSEFVWNESGSDHDFRVESSGNANMLFVNGGNDSVTIGGSSDNAAQLYVNGNIRRGGYTTLSNFNSNNDVLAFNYKIAPSASTVTPIYSGASSAGGSFIHMESGGGGTLDFRAALHGTDASAFTYTEAGRYLTVRPTSKTGGELVVNQDGDVIDFRVESDGNSNMLFVDGGNNRVGVGTGTPQTPMHIRSNSALNTTTELLRLDCGDNVHVGGKGGKIRFTDISVYNSTAEIIARREGVSGGSHLEFSLRDTVRLGLFSNGSFTTTPTTGGHAVFNEGGVDADFRVESNNKSQMMLIDGGQDRVAFGNGDTSRAFFTIDNDSGESTKPTLYVEGYPASAPTSIIRRDNTDSQYVLELHHDAPVSGSGGTGYMLQFADRTGVELGSIKSEGNSGTTYNTTSDRRLKDNIEPIADATDKLMSMKPVTHTWIADPEAPSVHGFIAQEMQEIVPEAVSGEDGGEEMMSMDYGRITPVLVAALQEATNEIKALKERVAELEAK